jgi:hypothetical protein
MEETMTDKELFAQIVQLLKQEVQERKAPWNWEPMTEYMHNLFQDAIKDHFNEQI